MTALTYLERVRTRRFLAKEAQQAVREARLDNYAIRSANAPGGGSGRPGGSDLSDLYIRLEEKELNAAKLLLELQNEQAEAREKILALPDDTEKAVLMGRYINDQDWRTIADHARMSLRTVYRIHREALGSFEELHKDFLNAESCH
ncbi:hypothetical protein [uncultured Megasphaera sp.]|uniref:hypothetical protein n=1 Tax=uncultured Megasphaera sp. TaxID=165188 RepID=UPI00266DA502|nr:hypothetical protein [uncultured Megasphaera sp.]